MSIVERIKRLFSGKDRTVDTARPAHRQADVALARVRALTQSEGGGIPPNYLPTGVDEGRPKK